DNFDYLDSVFLKVLGECVKEGMTEPVSRARFSAAGLLAALLKRYSERHVFYSPNLSTEAVGAQCCMRGRANLHVARRANSRAGSRGRARRQPIKAANISSRLRGVARSFGATGDDDCQKLFNDFKRRATGNFRSSVMARPSAHSSAAALARVRFVRSERPMSGHSIR